MTPQEATILQKANELVLSFLKKADQICESSDLLVREKTSLLSHKEIVTNIDQKLQQIFAQDIHAQFPDHHLVGEENDSQEKESSWKWYIDPIDGTTLFSRGLEEWGIIIALTFNEITVSSWVYLPYSQTLYSAIKDGGAYKNNQPISVSQTKELREAIISSVYLDTMDRQQVMLSSLWDQSRWTIVGRSLAKDFTEMAEGKIDVAICFNCASWEYKALSLLVEEARGLCFTFLGEPFDNTKVEPQNLIAIANQTLAPQILKLIKTPASLNSN